MEQYGTIHRGNNHQYALRKNHVHYHERDRKGLATVRELPAMCRIDLDKGKLFRTAHVDHTNGQ
jgi:hypothetical protein